ncbi:2-oxo acid dehydrogenase subunit E2 [Gramella sp. GC03-9]|uniref:Dihydrolipoamide acetyltransferase component of pyruvate dehydrogenase complex n=1 Tax=Christiangramia oceanisediminis TaxID=2920386 RepID=A0A9X2R9G8_9FLAO|nr:2-oxo acid dehydrogenase subunit E2 [Gramella oceanisediminis]MCP9200828.1 2-oxo acid dehydrogenase subunit E2 [Gramella oceanisediminis]
MAEEIKIPQISEGVDKATVNEVLVSEGDQIEKDQSLIVVESDKASVEIPSPKAGTVEAIKVKEGDEVEVGDVILTLEVSEDESEKDSEEDTEEKSNEEDDSQDKEEEETEEDSEKEKSKESKKKDKEKESSEDKEDTSEKEEEEKSDKDQKPDKQKDKKSDADKDEKSGSGKAENVPASPGVRRFAREIGVDITEVSGSGEGGRISKEDVKSHTKSGKKEEKSSLSKLPDFSKWGETEVKPLSNIRKATAKGTSAAWKEIPHVFQFEEADISGIEEFMEKNSEKAEKAGGKLSITAILIKIAATALQRFPKFNASVDMENEEMILKKYVNIGVAVDTEKGLLVPVIKDADKKGLIDISVQLVNLAGKARDGELDPDSMKGGNFSISNLGGFGGTNFTPIIYHPQVAILGVSRAVKRPVYVEDKLEPRSILPLSLSYDHRLIDGAEGVQFLNWIAKALEDPYEALLGA